MVVLTAWLAHVEAAEAVQTVGLTPIARWDVVPYQRINPGSPLNLGVVAFSKAGINRVVFTISGQGYKGLSPIVVNNMSLNPQAGVYEYWTPIRAEDFTTNGLIMVSASVVGNDGGIRDDIQTGMGLDPITLTVNPGGQPPPLELWVANPPEGDDDRSFPDEQHPLATVGGAVQYAQLLLGAGANCGGVMIHLKPGTYPVIRPRWGAVTLKSINEWITITTTAGGNAANTILTRGTPPSGYDVGLSQSYDSSGVLIRLSGLTVRGGGAIAFDSTSVGRITLWADRCDLQGGGRGLTGPHPLSEPPDYKQIFFTDCLISQVN
ncbi:MAG: hypothetical protein FWC56_04270, partial [Phycisphaerae bacterium]|nr:hypothetical protein [Phycisphaerae bacterium]